MKATTRDHHQIVNELLASGKAGVVVFEKDWSGACQLLEPVLSKLTRSAADGPGIIRINVEQHPDIAARFGIYQVPTIVFMKDNEVQDTLSGLIPYDILKMKFDSLFA